MLLYKVVGTNFSEGFLVYLAYFVDKRSTQLQSRALENFSPWSSMNFEEVHQDALERAVFSLHRRNYYRNRGAGPASPTFELRKDGDH